MKFRRSCHFEIKRVCLIVLGIGLIHLAGCSSSSTEDPPVSESKTDQSAESDGESTSSTGPIRLGNLLEPFDAPPLEELLAKHEWVDRPVVDSMQRMREFQSKLPPPQLSPAEALKLRNETDADNEKIIDTLGRLAPESGEGVDFDAQITLLATGDLKSTNPLLISSVIESDYHSLTSFGLFSFDKDLEKFAATDSVVSWKTSEDRLVDILILRDDLTWSDGTPITAHDIAFTFQAIMTDEVIIPAVRQGTDKIRWIQAYDDRTVVYFHQESLATNEGNMNFSIIPKHIYEKTIPADPTMARSKEHSHFEDHPVVGGAYMLTKRVRGQEHVLERRDSYYMHNGKQVRDKPYFQTVRYKVIEDRNTALLALKAGKIDSLELLAEQWQGQTGDEQFYRHNTKATGLEWTSFHFCWNTETPYFQDKRVRQAMSHAMDYKELMETIFYDLYQPSRGTFHPTSWMFPKEGPRPYHQDLDKAEQLLDEAGWVDSDGDGIRDKIIQGRRIPFEFTLMVVNIEDRVKVVTLMKECLDSIGVICHVKPTEFTVLTQRMRDHKFQAAFAGWGTGADPDTLTNIFVTDEGRNYGKYSNPQVDQLFEQARYEFDREKRAAIYGKIHNLLWEDQPYTWLFYRNSFYGFNKKLRGYNFSPRGPFTYGPGMNSFYVPVDVP